MASRSQKPGVQKRPSKTWNDRQKDNRKPYSEQPPRNTHSRNTPEHPFPSNIEFNPSEYEEVFKSRPKVIDDRRVLSTPTTPLPSSGPAPFFSPQSDYRRYDFRGAMTDGPQVGRRYGNRDTYPSGTSPTPGSYGRGVRDAWMDLSFDQYMDGGGGRAAASQGGRSSLNSMHSNPSPTRLFADNLEDRIPTTHDAGNGVEPSVRGYSFTHRSRLDGTFASADQTAIPVIPSRYQQSPERRREDITLKYQEASPSPGTRLLDNVLNALSGPPSPTSKPSRSPTHYSRPQSAYDWDYNDPGRTSVAGGTTPSPTRSHTDRSSGPLATDFSKWGLGDFENHERSLESSSAWTQFRSFEERRKDLEKYVENVIGAAKERAAGIVGQANGYIQAHPSAAAGTTSQSQSARVQSPQHSVSKDVNLSPRSNQSVSRPAIGGGGNLDSVVVSPKYDNISSRSDVREQGTPHTDSAFHDSGQPEDVADPNPANTALPSTSELLSPSRSELPEEAEDTLMNADNAELLLKVAKLQRQVKEMRRYFKTILELEEERYVPAIVKIQACFRGYLVRKDLRGRGLLLRRAKKAPKWMGRESLLDECGRIGARQSGMLPVDAKEGAAARIQCHFRGFLVRKKIEAYRRGDWAATTVQRIWRGYRTRKHLGPTFALDLMRSLARHQAERIRGLVVEAELVKGRLNRQEKDLKSYEHIMRKVYEEVEVLRTWKAHSERVAANKASTLIQKCWRGFVARKEYAYLIVKSGGQSGRWISGEPRIRAPGPLRILVGATGSVASIKVPLLVKKIKEVFEGDVEVRIVATTYALHFFKAADVEPVEVFTDASEWEAWTKISDPVLHIELRNWADAMVIAPLDANTLSKIANGMCDNLLTCILRAWDTHRPVIVCPAMNTNMWDHIFTARHLKLLTGMLRYTVVQPVSKVLACGDTGIGAMAEPATIAAVVRGTLEQKADVR